MKKKVRVNQAVDDLTDLVVAHLDQLPAAEREKRIAAMERRVARFSDSKSSRGSYAKSPTPAETPAIHLASRDPGE